MLEYLTPLITIKPKLDKLKRRFWQVRTLFFDKGQLETFAEREDREPVKANECVDERLERKEKTIQMHATESSTDSEMESKAGLLNTGENFMKNVHKLTDQVGAAARDLERAAARRLKMKELLPEEEPDETAEVRPDPRNIRKYQALRDLAL